jgi:hypothetical protein
MPLGSVCSDLSISNISNVEVSTASLNNASNAKSSPPGERKALKSRVWYLCDWSDQKLQLRKNNIS